MSRPTSSERRRRHGRVVSRGGAFTLVEMLLVLVIIAVLSSSVAVSICGRSGRRVLRVAARDLAAAVGYASCQARSGGYEHRVVFLQDGRAYRVESLVSEFDGQFAPVRGQAGAERSMPPGVRIASVFDNTDTFKDVPDWLEFGSGDCGFAGRIVLEDEDGRSASIEVVSRTGQVLITE